MSFFYIIIGKEKVDNMKAFDTHVPTKLIFGAGTIARLGETAKEYGKQTLIVTTGDDMKKLGLLDKALDSLNQTGVSSVVFSDVEPNPKTYNIDAGVKVYIENGCELAIGLGGGSAMDAAKAIAMVAKNGGSVMEYMPNAAGVTREVQKTDPVICITTTAGTGSEATYFSVITNPITHEKPGIGSPSMMPVASIIDPELMLSLPVSITAQTGVDVFFHAMEAYLNQHATPYTDMLSLEAMRIVAVHLPKVLADPGDIESRSQMAWANTMGGIAIVLSATCGLHAMGHSISGVTDIAHGRALSAAAVAFMDYTYRGNIGRYAEVARILGADASLSDEEASGMSGKLLRDFLLRCGMAVTLTEVEVDASHIEKIAKVSCSSMRFCMDATLWPLEKEDILKMLRGSLK